MVARWDRNGIAAPSPRRAAARSPIEEDLDALAYRHLMGDDAGQIERGISVVQAAVSEWSTARESARTRDQLPVTARAALQVARPMAPERSFGIDL